MKRGILAINPGGGSTRVALFEGERLLWSEERVHDRAELVARGLEEQLAPRLGAILQLLDERGLDRERLAAVVARGGPYRPLPGGVYAVNRALLDDVEAGRLMADHPSKLGAVLAARLVEGTALPALVVDPVSVDELAPWARITGLPELARVSLFHALNIKAVARRFAAREGRPLEALALVVAHLGSGASVALIREGRVVDVNNSADEGPFSTRRAGGLPASALLELAARPGFDPASMKRRMMSEGGLLAHLGSADLAQAERRASQGDGRAALVLEAMALGVVKAVGGLAAVAEGRLDAILLTGGMVRSEPFVARLVPRLSWIAPVYRFPGEDEMRALAEGARAALEGREPIRRYPDGEPVS
jgi:butyrate kinase